MIDFVERVALFPLYLVRTSCCDKLSSPGRREQRYFVYEGRCECLGYLKFGACKHLQMRRGEYPTLRGVPAWQLIAELNRVGKVLGQPALAGDMAEGALKSASIQIRLPPDILKCVYYLGGGKSQAAIEFLGDEHVDGIHTRGHGSAGAPDPHGRP